MGKALDDIIRDKHDRLDSVPNELEKALTDVQKKILNEVEAQLRALEYDSSGSLVMNNENLSKVQIISNRISSMLSGGEYDSAVRTYLKEFHIQAELNNAYFEEAFDDFRKTDVFQRLVQIGVDNAKLLLSVDSINTVLMQPLSEAIIASIGTEATFADAVNSIKAYIVGNKDSDGRLLRYARQNVFDAFAIFDRVYTHTVASKIDVEFYRYIGGLIRDTRPFCKEHNGQYLHYKEIELLGEETWAGQRQGTNPATIFTYCGGYNCRHTFLPVAIGAVPDKWLMLAEEKGFYNP
jgi:hypothetical protein